MVPPRGIELPTTPSPIMFYLHEQFIYQLIGFIKYIFNLKNEIEYYLVEIDI